MRTNTLATALALSDQDLLTSLVAIAGQEREATAELVARLAALELRPSLHASEGYGSLFAYCTEALRLSEDAACNRIAAARACRDFPVILDLLAAGSLTMSSVRMLRPHLTPENHEAVLARALNARGEQIQALVAELAPKPDVVASVRKLPVSQGTPDLSAGLATPSATLFDPPTGVSGPVATANNAPSEPRLVPNAAEEGEGKSDLRAVAQPTFRPKPRRAVLALSPQRYRVQFTVGQESHDKLRRVQALLRREVPNGDPGIIFERALDLFLEKVEKAKLGAAARTRQTRPGTKPGGAYENRIRRAADNPATPSAGGIRLERRQAPSRHIPTQIKRTVWRRDAGRCAFVSAAGHRCTERNFLELHHIHPYAMDGPVTVGNISLRCRRHNQYEAEVVFGGRGRPAVSEPTGYGDSTS